LYGIRPWDMASLMLAEWEEIVRDLEALRGDG
jgi:hypothetical protein